jgi:hypothetical protein
MALSTEAKSYLSDLYQEFSMLPPLVRVAMYAGAIPNLLEVYQPLCDCSDGKLKQHFPNCAHHHDCVELRDQLMLQVLRNKRIDRHLEQILHDEKVELNVDKECEQIYLI